MECGARTASRAASLTALRPDSGWRRLCLCLRGEMRRLGTPRSGRGPPMPPAARGYRPPVCGGSGAPNESGRKEGPSAAAQLHVLRAEAGPAIRTADGAAHRPVGGEACCTRRARLDAALARHPPSAAERATAGWQSLHCRLLAGSSPPLPDCWLTVPPSSVLIPAAPLLPDCWRAANGAPVATLIMS